MDPCDLGAMLVFCGVVVFAFWAGWTHAVWAYRFKPNEPKHEPDDLE